MQHNQSSLTQMQSAFDHFNEHRNTLKMTTGSAEMDSLIDSIQEGQFYLFYGKNKPILDALVHGFLVNCVLPVREKHGFESMAIYMNNVDYYQPNKSQVISPEKIAIAAKHAGIEPKIIFKNLFIQMAYNQQHQLAVTKQISELIESEKQEIKLLVVNNLTKASSLIRLRPDICPTTEHTINSIQFIALGIRRSKTRKRYPVPYLGNFKILLLSRCLRRKIVSCQKKMRL